MKGVTYISGQVSPIEARLSSIVATQLGTCDAPLKGLSEAIWRARPPVGRRGSATTEMAMDRRIRGSPLRFFSKPTTRSLAPHSAPAFRKQAPRAAFVVITVICAPGCCGHLSTFEPPLNRINSHFTFPKARTFLDFASQRN